MVPQPVKAVLLLFPISETLEAERREEDERTDETQEGPKDVIWIKQTVSHQARFGRGTWYLNNSQSFTTDCKRMWNDWALTRTD